MRGIVGTFVLAAAVAAPALAQDRDRSGFDRPYWLDRAVIEAVGRAEIEAMPDQGEFSVTFREVARSAEDAAAQASDRARLATEAMRRRGGDSVMIASRLSIDAIYAQYRDREGEMQENERADRIENYVASLTLSVTVRDIARASDVRAAALAVGPESAEDLSFSLRMTAEMQQRAFVAAARDAAARARLAAEASGAQLGPLLALQEGQGPCLGSWYGPRPGAMGPAPAAPAQRYADDEEQIVVTGSRRRLTLSREQIERLQLPADPLPIRMSAQVCAVYAAGG